MSLEYEFEITNNIKNIISSKSVDIFDYITRKFKVKYDKKQMINHNLKQIFKCSNVKTLNKIVRKVLVTQNANITYIIKNDDKNDIYDVLYDIDCNYFNTEIANELENMVLASIYENIKTF